MCSELSFSRLSLLAPASAFPGPHWVLLMENYFFVIVFQKQSDKKKEKCTENILVDFTDYFGAPQFK